MEANYVHKDSTTLVQDELVKNELNQIELQYNALEQQKFNELLKENEELKKKLEEINKMIEKCGFVNIEQVILNYCGLLSQQKGFISYLEDKIYSIEPKGTGIIYNCEYDSEEDYVMAMQEQSRLNALKEILKKYKSIIGDVKNEN
jgi:hypothetical protein